MRDQSDLQTIDETSTVPIERKVMRIFGAITSASFLVVFFTSCALVPRIGYEEHLKYFVIPLTLVWVLVASILLLALKTLLRRNMTPLIAIATWAKTEGPLKQIAVPDGSSQEMRDIYEIVNQSISRLHQAQDREIESQRNAGIAKTVQMLAHDVRKPFFILKMGISMLRNAQDHESTQEVLASLVPEVDRALSNVNGLLSDVMELGSDATNLIRETTSPESLIESSLGDISRVYPDADISLAYELKHTQLVNIHRQKVLRVFSNILENAVQAIHRSGKIWFRTRESSGFVEFCIGNAGSYIPAENLPKLFEEFFTKGKKTGTGLGLAIAQKVVLAHGGKIWCESRRSHDHQESQVEFFFTLPIGEGDQRKETYVLPTHSSDIVNNIAAFSQMNAPSEVDNGT